MLYRLTMYCEEEHEKYLFATGLLVCITPFTQAETSAQCSAQQDQIIAQALNITTEDLAQRQLDSTCKTDPEMPDIHWSAMPYLMRLITRKIILLKTVPRCS